MAEVTFSGPFFDPNGDQILSDGVLAARHAVADRGVGLVREAFDGHIRVNTGHHTSTITTTDESRTYTSDTGRKSYSMGVDVAEDTTVITTSNATYGPWLSGTGSRNLVTRFKGYPAFSEAADELDGQAQQIADDALAPYIDKLNG
jgi:hypothetical protein